MKTLLVFLSLSASAGAGEFAVLTTGFRLYADRHEADGATVRLYQKDGGFAQLRGEEGFFGHSGPVSTTAIH